MPDPLSLSDDQLDAIMTAAAPLSPDSRSEFLAKVALALQGAPAIGDGCVYRVLAELQREFWSPPDLARTAGASKYR